MEKEDKARFVSLLSSALMECGNGRYDRILPLTYSKEGSSEYVYWGKKIKEAQRVNVTLDSLMAIMVDIARELA